jgi:hypothetical protein
MGRVARGPLGDAEPKGRRMPGSDLAHTRAAEKRLVAKPHAWPSSPAFLVRIALPAALLAVVLAVVVRGFARPLTNPDTFFHLRFGAEFLNAWSLRDPGSVTSQATAHWVPTQWLPEIVMARFEDWFGLPGVAWLAGAVVVGLVAAYYVAARRRAEPLVAVALVMAALFASSIALSARPQVISYVFVVLTVDAWLRTAADGRPRWRLVPMTWLWAMCHGMWPLGPAIGALALVGIALDRRTSRAAWLRLAGVPALSAVAAALTPVGPELYVQLLRVQDRAQYFQEWRSPPLTNHVCVTLLVLLAVTGVALVRTAWPGWVWALLLAGAVACALWSWRTVPVSAAILVPLVAPVVQRWTGRRSSVPGRREILALATGCCVALGALGLAAPGQVADPTSDPAWLRPAMTALPSGTEVLSTWDTSALLMWRFPRLDVIAHGYGDTYTLPELRRSYDVQVLAPGWVSDLKQTGCAVAVLPTSSPLATALVTQEHWQVVHQSPGLEMLTAPSGWSPA